MEFIWNDGGRSKYFKGKSGDCVTRAIAIAENKDYKTVYDSLFKRMKKTPRNGVKSLTSKQIMAERGWKWVAIRGMWRLDEYEFPKDKTVIVNIKGHFTTVIDGKLLHDTWNPMKTDGRKYRPLLGYYVKKD